MAGNIIVGFAPAAIGGSGKGAASGSAGQTAGPLGLFGALLGAATIEETAATGLASVARAALEGGAAGLPAAALPLDVEFGPEAPAEPESDGAALPGELIDALAALDQALASGEPISPALTEKLSEALDALAGLLGIPLPADPVTGPTPAGTGDGTEASPPGVPGAADPLLALAAPAAPAPLPGSESPRRPTPVGTEVPPAAPAGFAAPLLPQVVAADAAPPGAAQATPPPSDAPPAADAGEATPVDPASGLARLVGRLAGLAQALEPQSPGLARRLEALAEKLTSGEIGAQAPAEPGTAADASLSGDDLDQALQKLLATSSGVKGTPAPQAFAAVQLKLPDAVALPPKTQAPAPPDLPPVGAPVEPEPEASPQPAPRLGRLPEAQDTADPQPAPRSSYGESLRSTAAGPEAIAEPATAQPAGQAAVPAATSSVAGTKAVHAAYQAPVHQINIPQVAFEVVRQVQAGNSRFQIRLDPPELGRIDVKLDVDQSGNVNARMTVERVETLDLMQRDQRALERALAQAGLDSSRTNLEFSLRQNPFARDDGGDGRGKGPPFGGGGETADRGVDAPEATQSIYRGSTSASGVNLFV